MLAGRERNFGRNLPSRSLQSAATRDQQHSTPALGPALTAVEPAALTAVGPTHIARAPECKLIIEIAQLLNTQQKRHKAHNTTRDQHPTLPTLLEAVQTIAIARHGSLLRHILPKTNCSFLLQQITSQKCQEMQMLITQNHHQCSVLCTTSTNVCTFNFNYNRFVLTQSDCPLGNAQPTCWYSIMGPGAGQWS